jgi:RecA/RadA recombinase
VTEIFGPESSGKSLLAQEICISAQVQKYNEIHLFDLEKGIDLKRARESGLDTEARGFKFYTNEDVGSIEELMGRYTVNRKKRLGLINQIARNLGPGKRAVIITDSITILPSFMQLDGKDKRGQSRPKAISGGMMTTQGDIAPKRIAVVFINQARQKGDDRIEFGRKRVIRFDSTGGQAIKHWPSVRVYLEEFGVVKDTKDGPTIGVRIWAFVYKNKIDLPFRECHFRLLFDYGIDNTRDSILWLRENTDILGGKSQWFSMPGSKKAKSLSEFIQYVEKKGREEELANLLRKHWIKAHAAPKREPRKRI